MSESDFPSSSPASLAMLRKGAGRRSAVPAAAPRVEEGTLAADVPAPKVLSARGAGFDPVSWTEANRARLREILLREGALLFRDMGIDDVDLFKRTIDAFSGGPRLSYENRSTPRTHLTDRIYTSTEYPAEYAIPLHNENSYTNSWPGTIFFYAAQPSESGGETPIADSRRIYAALDPALRARFESRGVMYVRNYGHLDLPWQEVFQTEDRGRVEAFCAEAGIGFEWRDGGALRTWQVCQASAAHPQTGETVWFNQAHLFHVSSLPDAQRTALLEACGNDGLPRNAYYGDGSDIEESALDEIRCCYAEHAIAFPWQRGDLLVLDNMLFAHGRMPYRGARRILVGMTH